MAVDRESRDNGKHDVLDFPGQPSDISIHAGNLQSQAMLPTKSSPRARLQLFLECFRLSTKTFFSYECISASTATCFAEHTPENYSSVMTTHIEFRHESLRMTPRITRPGTISSPYKKPASFACTVCLHAVAAVQFLSSNRRRTVNFTAFRSSPAVRTVSVSLFTLLHRRTEKFKHTESQQHKRIKNQVKMISTLLVNCPRALESNSILDSATARGSRMR